LRACRNPPRTGSGTREKQAPEVVIVVDEVDEEEEDDDDDDDDDDVKTFFVGGCGVSI
jgi:hypothetical protein